MIDQEENSIFAGRYRLLYRLGQGGMGQVWKCHDTILDINVALKFLLKGDDIEAIKRFQIEATSLGALDQKNIVRVLDFGFADTGELYLVMEHLEGIELKELINREGKLSTSKTIEVAEQVCQGLRKAHGLGLIHRDLKSSNILVCEAKDGGSLIKLVDFGTAKFEQSDHFKTRDGVVIGSPPYIAPELALGGQADKRSDIYSLGCVLYECLTGSLPFLGKSAQETIFMHIDSPVPALPDDVDSALAQLVYTCLEKDPEKRVQSVDDLIQRLKNIASPVDEASQSDLDVDVVAEAEQSKSQVGMYLLFFAIGLFLIAFLILYKQGEPGNESEKPLKEASYAFQVPDLADHSVFDREEKPRIEPEPNSSVLKSRGAVDDLFIKNYLSKNRDTGKWNLSQSKVLGVFVEYIDLNKLTYLNLKSTPVQNMIFKDLSKAENLGQLEIQQCRSLTPSGLLLLAKNSRLSGLSLSAADNKAGWISAVSELSSLEGVAFDVNLVPADLEPLKKLSRLGRLGLSSPSSELINSLTILPGLNYLDIKGELDREALKALSTSFVETIDIADVEGLTLETDDYIESLESITGPKRFLLNEELNPDVIKELRRRNRAVHFIQN